MTAVSTIRARASHRAGGSAPRLNPLVLRGLPRRPRYGGCSQAKTRSLVGSGSHRCGGTDPRSRLDSRPLQAALREAAASRGVEVSELATGGRLRTSPPCGRAPKAGRRGFGWPFCPCTGTPTRPGSWPPSPATTAPWPTICLPRCSPASRRRSATSCSTPASPTRSAAGWPTPLPAVWTAPRGWPSSSAPTHSSSPLTQGGPGTAITGSSPSCSERSSATSARLRRWPSCTCGPLAGTLPTGSPCKPSATP